MRVVIMGCGHGLGMRAAMEAVKSLGHNVVTIDDGNPYKLTNNRYDVNYSRDKSIKNHINMFKHDDTYAEQTAPMGRSGQAHNLILAMNKKGRKW